MKRNLFAELKAGFDELKAEREGKLTLRKLSVDLPDIVEITADEIKAIREANNASQAIMVRRLRVNERTY
jgi:putative transcriptional regulator